MVEYIRGEHIDIYIQAIWQTVARQQNRGIMDSQLEIKRLLTEWGLGHVMNTAYDTAWIARLADIDSTMSNTALNWICENQNPDGSWGAGELFYYHDRVISTISAMLALSRRGRRANDKLRIDRGRQALERIASDDIQGFLTDPNATTVGYETIMPTLVAEAEKLNILDHQGERLLGPLTLQRKAKLERLKDFKISRNLTIAYSVEMAGPDFQHLLDLEHLQEDNGSIAYSPSATAYFAKQVCPGDAKALSYLRGVVAPDGGAPGAAPFDIYERAWVLWNLALTGRLGPDLQPLYQPHVDALLAAWDPRRGIGFGTGCSIQDGDDTSLVYAVLTVLGLPPDIKTVYHYEEQDHFRCYYLETNPSISTNVHCLEVFRLTGADKSHPSVQKILQFLRKNRINGHYWSDKWHISPYYTTAHFVMASRDFDFDMAETAVRWILETRNPDGSWGYFMPTAEETAYALQALTTWNRYCGPVPKDLIRQSANWLEEHANPPYPPLWIAKSLYTSDWVVRSEIISALVMAEQN